MDNTMDNIGYSSHGEYLAWDELKKLEVIDRDNYSEAEVMKWEKKYSIDDTDEVIWITKSKRICYSYMAVGSDHDAIMNIPEEQLDDYATERGLDDIEEIDLSNGVIIAESDDGDEGYLFIWRPTGGKCRQIENDFTKQLRGIV